MVYDLYALQEGEILLGCYDKDTPDKDVINYITLYTKYYINRQRLFHQGELSFVQWLREIKRDVATMKYGFKSKKQNWKFEKWIRIYESL